MYFLDLTKYTLPRFTKQIENITQFRYSHFDEIFLFVYSVCKLLKVLI